MEILKVQIPKEMYLTTVLPNPNKQTINTTHTKLFYSGVILYICLKVPFVSNIKWSDYHCQQVLVTVISGPNMQVDIKVSLLECLKTISLSHSKIRFVLDGVSAYLHQQKQIAKLLSLTCRKWDKTRGCRSRVINYSLYQKGLLLSVIHGVLLSIIL